MELARTPFGITAYWVRVHVVIPPEYGGKETRMLVQSRRVERPLTAREAAALVRSGDWLDYGAVLAQPDVFDQAVAERASELRNVNIRGCLRVRPRAVVDVDPGREHFNYLNWHFGAYDRKKSDAGLQSYIPT